MLNLWKFMIRSSKGPIGLAGMVKTKGDYFLSRELTRRSISSSKIKYDKDLHPILEEDGVKKNTVDVLIMGGGVMGSALTYLLVKHCNIKKITFLSEKKKVERNLIYHLDNTIHSGETDSNIDLHQALRLLKLSNILRNLVNTFPREIGKDCIEKKTKILLGLGEEENNRIEKRFDEFRHFFPKIKLVNGKEIARLEPKVAYLDDCASKLRNEKMNGILLQDEYTTINYDILSSVLKKLANDISFSKRTILENYEDMNIKSIKRVSSNGEVYYKVDSDKKSIYSRFLVINDIGNSFKFVRELGYCSDWIALNMFGKFQMTINGELKGVVSTMQDLSLPESTSVYGFPEIYSNNNIRFLSYSNIFPIISILKSMNMNNYKSSRGISLLNSNFYKNLKEKLLKDKMERLEMEIPKLVYEQIIQGSKKMIPSLSLNKLKNVKEDLGISINQLLEISREKNELILDRSKIHTDENLILNISQPISGTTCIGSACEDMITICNKLGININESSLKKDIPEYEVDESDFKDDI